MAAHAARLSPPPWRHVQVRTSCPGDLQQEHRRCWSSSSKPMLWLNLASCARLRNRFFFTFGRPRPFFTCGSTKPSANWSWPSHAAMSRSSGSRTSKSLKSAMYLSTRNMSAAALVLAAAACSGKSLVPCHLVNMPAHLEFILVPTTWTWTEQTTEARGRHLHCDQLIDWRRTCLEYTRPEVYAGYFR